MAIYWPTPGFKGRTFKLCVFTRWDCNFCVRSSPLRGFNTTLDVILICGYVPPQGSPYYDTAECNRRNDLIDKCTYTWSLGEMWRFPFNVVWGHKGADIQLPSQCGRKWLSPAIHRPSQPNSLMSQSRLSQDDTLNDFGRNSLRVVLMLWSTHSQRWLPR